MRDEPPPLGDLEHELLEILWTHGEMTAADVRKRVGRDLKDATVRTVLRRLEDKGYVSHSTADTAFIYRPTESAETAAANAVKGIVDRFCGGSMERVLEALVKGALINPQQLVNLAERLKRKPR
jgi:predicted transcriptional regulator